MDYLPKILQRLRILSLIALPLALASCVESDLFYIINADGSGKVTTRERIPTAEIGIKDKLALEQVALSTLAEFILLSKGVDTWESVRYEFTKDGDVIVEATALFPDLAKLDLASTASSPTLGGGMKFEKGGDGKPASIKLRSPIATTNEQELEGDPPTPDAIEKELSKTRKNWAQNQVNIRKTIGKQRAKVTLHLPGSVKSSTNLVKDARNQVSLEVKSKAMIDILEKVIADDDLARKILKTGAKLMANSGPPPIEEDTFNKLAFGEAAPIRVTYDPKNEMFDYRKAVENAKANPSELMKNVITESQRKE